MQRMQSARPPHVHARRLHRPASAARECLRHPYAPRCMQSYIAEQDKERVQAEVDRLVKQR